MFSRFFKLLGYRTGDQIMDFIMIGGVVVPFMLVLDDQHDAAALAMLAWLAAIPFFGLWTRNLEAIREADELAREKLKRRISGGDN